MCALLTLRMTIKSIRLSMLGGSIIFVNGNPGISSIGTPIMELIS
jgi:hypothetical protein